MKCQWCKSDSDCDCSERINCRSIGKITHASCGICPKCNYPRFSNEHADACILTKDNQNEKTIH